jgi:hypothetical protein
MFDITIICNKQRRSPHETAKENVVFQLTTLSDGKIMKYEFRAMEKRYWQGKIKVSGKKASGGAVLSNQYFV